MAYSVESSAGYSAESDLMAVPRMRQGSGVSAEGTSIQITGCELSSAERGMLLSGLSQIQNEAPSDATSSVIIASSGRGFTAKITIRSLARRFEVESFGSNFDEAVGGLVSTVLRQIQLWQSERFAELVVL